MPAPIVGSIGAFLQNQLGIDWWDGEVPRYGLSGEVINPINGPPGWPVVRVIMEDEAMERGWTTEDPYDDRGPIVIEVWATSRKQLEDPVTGLLNLVEQAMVAASNWGLVFTKPPYQLYECLFERWGSRCMEGMRTADNQLLYKGTVRFLIGVHGAVSTQ